MRLNDRWIQSADPPKTAISMRKSEKKKEKKNGNRVSGEAAMVSRENRARIFTALVLHSASKWIVDFARNGCTGASGFKIHADGLKGISAFCENQSDCK